MAKKSLAEIAKQMAGIDIAILSTRHVVLLHL